jgi:hypothetical protein
VAHDSTAAFRKRLWDGLSTDHLLQLLQCLAVNRCGKQCMCDCRHGISTSLPAHDKPWCSAHSTCLRA